MGGIDIAEALVCHAGCIDLRRQCEYAARWQIGARDALKSPTRHKPAGWHGR